MTAGCRGCIAVNRGGQAVNHSEMCRSRVSGELVKKGDKRVSREKERWEEELTEALQDEDINLNKEEEEEEEERMEEEEEREEKSDEEERDIVMELSRPVKKWNRGVEQMENKMREENLFWGDLDEVRQESHVIGRKYWDDLSGAELDPSLVMAARSEEMKEFAKRNVYNKVPIRKC